MFRILYLLWKDDSGATAIEYGLIVGIMSAVMVGALATFSEQLKNLFEAISGKLEEATEQVSDPPS